MVGKETTERWGGVGCDTVTDFSVSVRLVEGFLLQAEQLAAPKGRVEISGSAAPALHKWIAAPQDVLIIKTVGRH